MEVETKGPGKSRWLGQSRTEKSEEGEVAGTAGLVVSVDVKGQESSRVG